MPRRIMPADNRDENVRRRNRLRTDVDRIERDLSAAEQHPSLNDWRQRATKALEHIEDDLGDIEDWLIDHDRLLLKQATELLETLIDELEDEYDLVKQLVERQKNP